MKRLGKNILCVIIDRDALGKRDLLDFARKAASSGAGMIQYRDKHSSTLEMAKTARLLKCVTDRFGIPLVINDRPEVALSADAAGLHIGQEDLDAALARKIIGNDKLLGVSAGNLKKAKDAENAGADYIGLGPIFNTPIKGSKKAIGAGAIASLNKVKAPIIAIGGINLKNIKKLTGMGFRNAAVIRAVCASSDPFKSTMALRKALC